MNPLASILSKKIDALIEEMIRQYTRQLEKYRNASEKEIQDIRQTTRQNVLIFLQLLSGQAINENAFDASIQALGERRARQGFPLDQVMNSFHIAMRIIYQAVQQAVVKDSRIKTQHLLEFDLIFNRFNHRIDLGIVRPFLQFQDNIIRSQQSFLKHKFSSLFKLVEAISNNLNIQEFCRILLNYLCRFYDVKVSAVMLLDDRGRELIPQQVSGLSRRFVREQRFPATADPFRRCLDSGQACAVVDAPYAADDFTIPLPETEADEAKSAARSQKAAVPANPVCHSLYAPMLGRQRTYGMVSIHSLKFRHFSNTEIQQMETLARILAVAIENARFYENLIEEKGKLDAIVNSISDGLILVNFREEIVFINEQAARYLNLPAAKLIDASASLIPERLLTNTKEPHVIQAAYLRALLNILEQPVLEFTLYKPEVADIRLTMFPVKDREQRFIGRGMIIEDISREKEVNRLKSEFVAIASHTMRTPMTSILGFASLLIERKLAEGTQMKYLQNIYRESQRLTNILNDMLDLANIEAGKISLKLTPIEIAQIVTAAASDGRKQYRRNIVVRTPPNLPRLLADGEKIRQVVQNLISNAAKYAGNKIQIAVRRISAPRFRQGWARSSTNLDSPGYFPAIAVCVEDGGEGIPSDQLDEIFEPFHRVDNERTQMVPGSGLGLTIVRYIVEAHGGKIWVESKTGKGCAFTFILPLELTQPDRDYYLSLAS